MMNTNLNDHESKLEKYYFDYFATTPCDPKVRDVMMQSLCQEIGNPSSAHVFGWEARQAVEKARMKLAKCLDVRPTTLTFTSGATESNQMVLFGLARHFKRGHMITQNTEHKAILDALPYLKEIGIDATVLNVNSKGEISLEALEQAIRPDTFLVSIMHVNNEIGVIHPLAEIAKICQKHQILLHSDGAQAVGKLKFSLDTLGVDLYACSAHKFYGPKGIGALYIRKKEKEIPIKPIFFGGGQEKGLRPGTLATHQIVGIGHAAQILSDDLETELSRIAALRDQLWQSLQAICPSVELNGCTQDRVAGILNFRAPIDFANELDDVLSAFAYSRSSACSSADQKGSHVLSAIGLTPEQAHHSFRFGIGRMTTQASIDHLISMIQKRH